MRHGPHSHPCKRCGVRVECCGDIEQNFDGFPEWICREYHNLQTGSIEDLLCEDCTELVDAENREPPEPDGEDMFRDYQAEERDRMEEARKLK